MGSHMYMGYMVFTSSCVYFRSSSQCLAVSHTFITFHYHCKKGQNRIVYRHPTKAQHVRESTHHIIILQHVLTHNTVMKQFC